jgi:integrase
MTTRALTDSEITLLDEALVKRGRFRDRALLVMATDTGFRISELLSLTWPQLLSATGEIRQDVTIERAQLKGGAGPRRKVIRSRRVPLSERVRGAIADALGTYGSVPQGPVFKSRIGENRPITRIFAHRQLKALAREIGLDASRLGFHSARKSFAVRVHAAAQFDLVKTQRILGHQSPLTTAKYLETTEEQLDAIVLGLNGTPPGGLASPAKGKGFLPAKV